MSLRGQVFVSVILALLLGLSALGAVACWQARRSVAHEMQMALEASDRIVDNALLSLPQSGTDAYLARLVRSFDGNRHIRVSLIENGRAIAVSQVAPHEAAPAWFVRLLEIAAEHRQDGSPRLPGRLLLVTADPHNEISEVWYQFRDGALILGFFSLLMLALLHLLMARLSRPLALLARGFEAVGGGDYGAHVTAKGPRELALLAGAFNRMAERLQELEAANRRMSRQMLAIQEEERADLARELHDEMGPFLFALRVEAEAITRLAGDGGIAARARAVGDAVMHLQSHVRAILRQLRPGGLTEIGLAQAIANLITFFRQRHDAIIIALDVVGVRDDLPPDMGNAIYRLVQEGLTNAARHSAATHLWITVTADDEVVRVTVEDDGRGFGTDKNTGLGLKGMRERLQALDGTLEVSARPGGGARLAAVIPRVPLLETA